MRPVKVFFFLFAATPVVWLFAIMRVTRYKLVVGSKEDLESEVNELIAAGWQPSGTPVVCSQDRPYEFCQVMICDVAAPSKASS